jgi:iron complex transport system substrate-binding protein
MRLSSRSSRQAHRSEYIHPWRPHTATNRSGCQKSGRGRGQPLFCRSAQPATNTSRRDRTQDLCHVCAISESDVAKAISELPSRPQVISLTPHTLEQVLENIETVGEGVGRQAEAGNLVAGLRQRIEQVRARAVQGKSPRVLCLEWLSPLFQGGHWIPEMVSIAGGDAVLAAAGERSTVISWEQVFAADPEVVVVMPCGFHLKETIEQYRNVSFPDGWKNVSAVRNGQVYAVDGTAYFSRPGPRLVTGLEILQAILRNASFDQLPPESVAALGELP